MKRIFIFCALCLTFSVYSQDFKWQINEGERDFIAGRENALVMNLPGVKEKMASKIWDDHLKRVGKSKRMKEIGGQVTSEANVYSISGYGKINIYSKMESDKQQTTLIVWFDTESGFLRSSNDAKAYNGAVAFLDDYGKAVNVALIEEELEAESKNLKSLEKDLDKLKKDKDGFLKDIENAKDKIAKSEKSIETNEEDQKKTTNMIKDQSEKVKLVEEKLSRAKR